MVSQGAEKPAKDPKVNSPTKGKKEDGWHIGKSIDVGHIVTTLLMVVGVLWWFADIDKRLALLEHPQAEMRQDIKDIKEILGPLPSFMERKELTDKEQDVKISQIQQERRE